MTREEAYNRIDAIIAKHEIDDDYVTITSLLDYDALRMARKALEQTRWIPVSERLPEDGQNVLFSTKTDMVFEGKYYADTSAHNWLSYKDDTYAWNNVVTAWMPLPQPYKGESEDDG